MSDTGKPTHAKPSLYAYYFLSLKEIAFKYGYNLVLHGSMNRDLDLIAIPWQKELGSTKAMINEMATELGGAIDSTGNYTCDTTHHGRKRYIIDLNRGGKQTEYKDPQYYIDISVVPPGEGFAKAPE